MGRKSRILKLIRLAYDAEQLFIDALCAEDRAATGEKDDWSPKDLVAHMSAWKEQVVINYQAARRGQEVPDVDDYHHMNEVFFEKHRHRSWDEILQYREKTLQSLLENVKTMSEEDLNSTEATAGQRGGPFWRMVVGTGYIHPLVHLRDPLLERGESEQAVEMQEQLCRMVSELDKDESWVGGQQYNLACIYSLVGQKEKAIRILREALRMSPELREWSKTDPDFEPIREHPEYKAIYIE